MLNDISGVKTWDKVNSGLIKMYRAEVLGKLPVAQHFLFSHLLPFPGPDLPSDNEKSDDEADADGVSRSPKRVGDVTVDEHGHLHVKGQGWGDCCGIPIPSAFAAAQEEKRALRAVPGAAASGNVRRIPFD
jgi:serine/threonine-protein phosphatase 2A activator